MAHLLFTPVPVAGHMGPALVLADELTTRGHEVRIISGRRFQSAIERTGARLVPFRSAPDLEFERLDELFPERPAKPGIGQARWDLKRLVVDLAVEQLDDVEAAVDDERPDVILADVMALSGRFAAERHGIPLALLNPINLFLPSVDTFPDGLGVAPSSSRFGRLRNRLANWLVFDLMLRDVDRHLRDIRASLGLPPMGGSLMAMPARGSGLILQGTVPEFEYPRSDVPPQLHFVGALLPRDPTDWPRPAWWPRLEADRPVVLVTQGTVATDFDDLVRPTLSALANEDMTVIATTGGRAASQLGEVPDNAIVEPFVPFGSVMPSVDVMVTNGGYGGIHYALAAGVPLVAAGRTEDKVETTARIAWSGVGIDLRARRPSPERLREAVLTVLRETRYRERARMLQARLRELDGPSIGAQLLERLAATGEPVLRRESPWDLTTAA